MKPSVIALFAFALPFLVPERTPSPPVTTAADDVVCIRTKWLWNGSSILEDRSLIVRDSRIAEIGGRDLPCPKGAREIVLPAGFVLPGLVLADAAEFSLPGNLPPGYAIPALAPDFTAGDAFDPFAPRRALRDGIVVVHLSPGRQRLLPGQGSVVRLGADPAGPWMLARSAALHAVVTPEAYGTPAVYEAPVPPGPDNPIRAPERQFPSSRAGAFFALRQAFHDADALRTGKPLVRADEGEVPDLRPLQPVLDGKLLLRVRAERSPEILGAIALATEAKAKLVIEGGTEAWKHADELARIGASVVLRAGTPPAGHLEPTAPFPPERGEANPDAAAKLKAAGVKVALVPAWDGGHGDLLWCAAQTVGPEFSWADALRSVTSEAADVLGVGASAGRIEVGRHADLVLFDQDPLAPAARPVTTIVGGRVVHEASSGDRPVAITARRVVTAAGANFEPGTVVVEKGKIVAVGRDVTVPSGAERVLLPDAVVVPGFIDSGTQVGMKAFRDAGDGLLTAGPPVALSGLEQRLTKSFDPGLPEVLAVAKSGVTTAVLSPAGGRPIAGVVSIVKLGGAGEGKSVVREIGGVLIDLSESTPGDDEDDRIRKAFEAGKKYAESFTKYEKDLKAWEKENGKDAKVEKPVRKLGPVTAPSPFDPWTGRWSGHAFGDPLPSTGAAVTLDIVHDGAKLDLAVTVSDLIAEPLRFGGTVKGDAATASFEVDGVTVKFEGTVGRDRLQGTWTAGGEGRGRVELRRSSRATPELPKSPPKDGAKKDGEKKEGEKKEGEKSEPATKGADAKAEAPAKPDDGKKGDEKTADAKKDEAKKDDEKKSKKPTPPKKNEALEPYRVLLDGETPVFVVVANERVARSVLSILRSEFEVRTVLASPEQVPALLDTLDEEGIALSPAGVSGRDEGTTRIEPVVLAVRRRVPVILRTGPDGDPRTLYAAASYAVRSGLDPEDALKAITAWSALVLGIQDRVGTIEKGKDADLVILSGDPFQAGTRVRRVMIDGRFVDRAESTR